MQLLLYNLIWCPNGRRAYEFCFSGELKNHFLYVPYLKRAQTMKVMSKSL